MADFELKLACAALAPENARFRGRHADLYKEGRSIYEREKERKWREDEGREKRENSFERRGARGEGGQRRGERGTV